MQFNELSFHQLRTSARNVCFAICCQSPSGDLKPKNDRLFRASWLMERWFLRAAIGQRSSSQAMSIIDMPLECVVFIHGMWKVTDDVPELEILKCTVVALVQWYIGLKLDSELTVTSPSL